MVYCTYVRTCVQTGVDAPASSQSRDTGVQNARAVCPSPRPSSLATEKLKKHARRRFFFFHRKNKKEIVTSHID